VLSLSLLSITRVRRDGYDAANRWHFKLTLQTPEVAAWAWAANGAAVGFLKRAPNLVAG
jgi:hypothetical protein